MKSPEFVESLSTYLGEPVASVRAVDRSLSEDGLRAKGRGANAPDISLSEGIRILLGLMGARTISRASEDVRDMQAFVPFDIKVRKGTKDVLPALVGYSEAELLEVRSKPTILDVLSRIAVASPVKDYFLWLKVEPGGPIFVQVEADGFTGEIVFSGTMNTQPKGRIQRTATISANALRWIAERCGKDGQA